MTSDAMVGYLLINSAVLMVIVVGLILITWRAVGALATLAHVLADGTAPSAGSIAGKILAPTTPPKPVQPPSPTPSAATSPVVDEALVAWLKKEEGFNPKAYGDFKQWSIGYGTKATSKDEVITEPDADKRLRFELAQAEQSVETFAPNAPKGVKQALSELTYNAGTGWQKSGLGAKIKAGDYEGAKTNFVQYVHAGGEVNDGLVARRNSSVKWFDNPI
jgi:GH24 family phage-related lysozyme (muramidase)